MKKIDALPISEAFRLYHEKHQALQVGDFNKLIELKKYCPDLFIQQNDEQIRFMINYLNEFESSTRYKELHQLDMRKKLKLIDSKK